MRRPIWLIGSMSLTFSSSAIAVDLDEDGLDDAFEQELIDRHRPFYIFDADEGLWPCSINWFVARSRLMHRCTLGFSVADIERLSFAQVAQSPLDILVQPDLYCPDLCAGCQAESNAQSSHAGHSPNHESLYYLDLANEFRGGEGPFPVGTYARVTRLQERLFYAQRPNRPVGDAGDFLVQYWQLFGYNESPCSSIFYDGDHEGDWLYLDVILDATSLSVKAIVHHHHGDNNCAVSIQPDEWFLPLDGVPVCYLEEDVHEWWPHPSIDDCTDDVTDECDPDWNDLGPFFRTENVKNVGELFAPMPDVEAQLFMLFNGHWGLESGSGSTASAPRFQTAPGFISAPRFVVYARAGAPVYLGKGLGSQYHPVWTAQLAVDSVESTGRVLFEAGAYSGTLTVDRAMTLEAIGGTVTIGD